MDGQTSKIYKVRYLKGIILTGNIFTKYLFSELGLETLISSFTILNLFSSIFDSTHTKAVLFTGIYFIFIYLFVYLLFRILIPFVLMFQEKPEYNEPPPVPILYQVALGLGYLELPQGFFLLYLTCIFI